MTRSKYYKSILALVAVALFISVSFTQKRLNTDRAGLGLTRMKPIENAPPVLAFSTVALGGFRGLIANGLWVRAINLQDDGKYFEMVQLADWITKLQPHMAAVWVNQAWNMAYNISIKFQDPRERWMWVQRGIELLRDQGLKYNPDEPSIYRELGWIFQHKMGAYLDDAHLFFKETWAREMTQVLGGAQPNFPELLNPTTEEAKARVKLLREKYKMDPQVMKAVDDRYGPLEWRLPETSAIYWAWLGLAKAKKEDLVPLRRVIFQSMQLAFQRGRIIESKSGKRFTFGANINFIENANRAYEDMMEQDPTERDKITTGHRNFLRDAVYFLYSYNRREEAMRWFKYLGEKYPNRPLLMTHPNSMPGTMSLDDYALDRVTEETGETSVDRTQAVLEGLLVNQFNNLALGFDDRAANYELLARKIWNRFMSKITGQEKRVGLPDLAELKNKVLEERLGPSSDLTDELKGQLRTELRLPAPTNAVPATTNAPPPAP